jgi:hypothetical protein
MSSRKNRHGIHVVQNEESDSDSDYFALSVDLSDDSVQAVKDENRNQLFATMRIKDQHVKFQIDTGATCNIINKSYLDGTEKLKSTNQMLTMYNDSKVKPLGKCDLKWGCGGPILSGILTGDVY